MTQRDTIHVFDGLETADFLARFSGLFPYADRIETRAVRGGNSQILVDGVIFSWCGGDVFQLVCEEMPLLRLPPVGESLG